MTDTIIEIDEEGNVGEPFTADTTRAYLAGQRDGAAIQLERDIAIVERLGAKRTLAAPDSSPVRYSLLNAFTDASETLKTQQETP